jgi:nucleoside-diphosphate-sugar epimerase
MPSPTLAVIGGTGFAGAATVNVLVAAGQPVRVIARHAPTGTRALVEGFAANAADASSLTPALEGVKTAILCARPDYWTWPTELVPMFENVLEAARRTGTRIVLCDNLYAYGVPNGPMTESSPLNPHGPKGRARQEAAELMMKAHEHGEVQVAIGRAADFYGPGVTYPNLKMLFGAALQGKTVRVMGEGTTLHSTSFINDVGRGLATLALHDESFGKVWHLPVAPPMTELDQAHRIVALAGTGASVGQLPSWAVHAMFKVMGLFSPMMRELPEVLYQHEQPFVVDDSRFVKAFGVRATDSDTAILETLAFWRTKLALVGPAAARAA